MRYTFLDSFRTNGNLLSDRVPEPRVGHMRGLNSSSRPLGCARRSPCTSSVPSPWLSASTCAALMKYIREGETAGVASMDHLGRSTRYLFDLVDEIAAKGAAIEFHKERIATNQNGSSLLETLTLGVMATFAEFEQNHLRDR